MGDDLVNNNKNLYEIDMNSLVLWEEINGKEYSPKEKLLLFINGNNYKNCNDENNFDTIDEFFNAFLKNNPKNKEYYEYVRKESEIFDGIQLVIHI